MLKTTEFKPIPSTEAVLAGVRRAVQKVIDEATRNDEELASAYDDKLFVIARDL